MSIFRNMSLNTRAAQPRGYLMLLALVFGAIFLGLLGALSGFILAENRDENISISNSKAFAIAEAGIEYYRWHLAEFPNDLQNGTGHSGPYTITYNDPEGGQAGTITLTISGNTECGQLTSVNIQSTGAPSDGTGGTATILAQWAKPSVALYSYILNSSVWAGADRVINGPYHSNGGIRMDGTANAPVTSSLASWTCTSTFGCGTNTTENGVFGAGTNSTLWSYPTPQVDFNAISANFSSLKTTAKASGLYFPRISSGSPPSSNAGEGYHLIFNSDGTVTVYKVTAETNVPSLPVDNSSIISPQADYSLIKTQSLYNDGSHPTGVYTIPSTCGLIFVEDNTWIEGAIPSEVMVVAANVTTSGITPNIMLPNNITYTNASGVSGLTAISANDILITPDSPQNMTLNGVFVAQGGAFGRNDYGFNSSGNITCPNSYEPRGTLTIHGTTVSNLRTGTQWSNSCNNGNGEAGYQSRIDAFDRQLSTNPPPFTPAVSPIGEIVNWRQTQ
jgi:hypothetical protein